MAELLAFQTLLSNPSAVELALLFSSLVMIGMMMVWTRAVSSRLQPRMAKSRVKTHVGHMEQLEHRQLLDAGMAGEMQMLEGESIVINDQVYENVDMIALAKAIAATGAKYYGAAWCGTCTAQKQLFGDGGKYLPFIDVTNPDRTLNQIGEDNNIQQFPTWVFPDEERHVGLLSIEALVDRLDITDIPTGTDPYLTEIGDVEAYAGEAIYVPLDGYTPTGEPLTYTVTTSSGHAETTVLQQNRSLRITMAGYGVMEFQLFEDLAPRVTNRIIQLAESGFYDGLTFHRILEDFMIQGGDPNGNGTGGSSLGQFADQYHPDLRHNTPGMLSMAKSFDDTNNSQFFITQTPQRPLDFQHSVFGVMTKGHKVLDAIAEIAVVDDPANGIKPEDGVPFTAVTMSKVEVFQDTDNAVLKLKSLPGITADDTVTVTVSDPDGNTTQRTFNVSFEPAPQNSNPFLNYVPDIVLPVGGTAQFQLSTTNVHNATLHYFDHARLNQGSVPASTGIAAPPAGFTYSVNPTTGLLQVETDSELTGSFYIVVGVAGTATPSTGQVDYQFIRMTIGESPVLNDFIRGMDEDATTTFNPTTNDTAPGSSISANSVRLTSLPEVGTAQVNSATGQITYKPPQDYFGTVTFDYVATNALGLAGTPATITIVVSPVNDSSTAYDDIFQADRNTAAMLDVLRNDDKGADNEADDPVTIQVLATSQAGGQLAVVDGKVQYTPPSGFVGTDTFTYTLDDNGLTSDATVTIEVQERAAFAISITDQPSSVDPQGQRSALPQSLEWVDEWSGFWVEVWASSDSVAQNGVSAAAATLSFDPAMFEVDSYQLGGSFTDEGSSFDNATGTFTLSGSASASNLGHNSRVLLGRVLFKPASEGPGISAPLVGESLGVQVDQFLSIDSVSLTANGTTVDEPTTNAMPPTRFIPVVYDLNNDGRIGLEDVAKFIASQGNPQPGSGASFIDFTGSGSVNMDDFRQLVRFYGATRGGDEAMGYSHGLIAMAMTDAMTASMFHVSTVTPPPVDHTLFLDAASKILENLNQPEDGSLASTPLTIKIVDLPGGQLARTQGSVIEIDYNAAGHGWFFDATPTQPEAFSLDTATGRYQAHAEGPAAGLIDFTTVLLHELGHLTGERHSDSGLMSPYLAPGERLVTEDDFNFAAIVNLIAIDSYFADF
ncbi:MAG: peptidylprolyl isomerase [Pirellulaceae bacterium]